MEGRETDRCKSCLVVAIVDAHFKCLIYTYMKVIAWTVWHLLLTSRTFASPHTAPEWCQCIPSHSSYSSDTCKDGGGGSHMCVHTQNTPLTVDTDTHIQPFTDEGGCTVTEMSEFKWKPWAMRTKGLARTPSHSGLTNVCCVYSTDLAAQN